MVSTHSPTSKSSIPFSYCTKSTNYNWHNCHLHVPQFFQFSWKVELFILLFIFFQFYSVVSRNNKVDNFADFLFLLIIIRSGFWPRFGDPSIRQSPIVVYVCHFLGQVLGYAYTIYSYGQIKIFCTSPIGSPCPPSRVSFCANLPYTPNLSYTPNLPYTPNLSYTPSVLICYIRLLYD